MFQRAFSFLFRSGSFASLALLAAFCGCGGEPKNLVVLPEGSTLLDEPDSATSTAAPADASKSDVAADVETLEIGGRQVAVGPKRALFNGENLDGWTNETGGAPGSGWQVADGLLRMVDPANGGDLLTKERFANYVFSFEWRFGRACNSGVKYKIEQPNGKGWVGLEYQIQDDANVEDGKNAKRRVASLFDVFPASETKSAASFPAPTDDAPSGEFRKGKIVVFENSVEHWLDGERVLAFTVGDDAWAAAKAESKYKKQATFGTAASSPILLQEHDYPIDFRNVEIQELKAL
ncbi:MAG: DUF1080 domain-containing protein [Thermoguttaceae bacterium]|nr:DUF1080 domain-containing protein [Thermoguttaceae bacterium]